MTAHRCRCGGGEPPEPVEGPALRWVGSDVPEQDATPDEVSADPWGDVAGRTARCEGRRALRRDRWRRHL